METESSRPSTCYKKSLSLSLFPSFGQIKSQPKQMFFFPNFHISFSARHFPFFSFSQKCKVCWLFFFLIDFKIKNWLRWRMQVGRHMQVGRMSDIFINFPLSLSHTLSTNFESRISIASSEQH